MKLQTSSSFLRKLSKILVFATLFLIFAGGMVTSTGSGLSVPDWPLSYGMVFPPMVGGVFYEHGHRLIATTIGIITLTLTIWILMREKRSWLKKLAVFALVLVMIQGVLGGLTVLFYLPTAISTSHAVTGQTFFVVTILIAYSFSKEREQRLQSDEQTSLIIVKWSLALVGIVFVQLMIGALMRHMHAGLAIYDFPTMAGQWIPTFDQAMLNKINEWQMAKEIAPVSMNQVVVHFLHRVGAVLVVLFTLFLVKKSLQNKVNPRIRNHVLLLATMVGIQFILGMFAIWTQKEPITTSVHVMIGAATLGVSFLLVLRVMPTQLNEIRFKKIFFQVTSCRT